VLLQAKHELQHLKEDMLCKSQTLQQQVVSLQGQLADAQLQYAATTSQLQQQLTQAERQVASAQREKQELTAALVALRQQESSRRLAAGEAAAKAERLRGELVRCVGELQVQLDASAAAGQQQGQQLARLRALEAAAGAARDEAGEARRQLVELATVSMRELREQVRVLLSSAADATCLEDKACMLWCVQFRAGHAAA
jgi:chromosome segregation ATPase